MEVKTYRWTRLPNHITDPPVVSQFAGSFADLATVLTYTGHLFVLLSILFHYLAEGSLPMLVVMSRRILSLISLSGRASNNPRIFGATHRWIVR